MARRVGRTYLIVWLGVVVQRQDVLQEDVKLGWHVLEQHAVVVALFDLAHLLLEGGCGGHTGSESFLN